MELGAQQINVGKRTKTHFRRPCIYFCDTFKLETSETDELRLRVLTSLGDSGAWP